MKERFDLTSGKILSNNKEIDPIQSKDIKRRVSLDMLFHHRYNVKSGNYSLHPDKLLELHCHRCSRELVKGISNIGGLCYQCNIDISSNN